MRLIDADKCTAVDLRTTWTIDDVFDTHEALDVADENRRRWYDKNKPKGKGR